MESYWTDKRNLIQKSTQLYLYIYNCDSRRRFSVTDHFIICPRSRIKVPVDSPLTSVSRLQLPTIVVHKMASQVPFIELNNGKKMPQFGLGTWGVSNYG